MTDGPTETSSLTGGCQCGAVRYRIDGMPLAVYVCHCTECRKQSASAFGISLYSRRENFSLVSGTPRWWSRAADSGRVVECAFCPNCGSRVWHERDGKFRDFVTIKGGSLDEPVDLSGATHIWTSRKLAGVVIPDGVPQFPKDPE